MSITLDAFGNPVPGDPTQGSCVTVEAIPFLRTFVTKPNQGDMVTALGGVTEGDGNGARYYWVDYITNPDDGVLYIKCDAFLAGRFVRFDGTGAVVTGGVTATVADRAALLSLNVTGYTSYVALIYVQSVRDYFQVVPSGGYTADGITLVTLSDGRIGKRLMVRDPFWIAQQTWWSVDPANGSDWNTGYGATMAAADASPLKSFKELYRRWHSGQINTPRIHLLSSMNFDGDSTVPPMTLYPNPNTNPGGGIHIVGEPVVVGSGTLTGVRINTDYASNNGKYILRDTSQSWTGLVTGYHTARMIRKTGTNLYAMVLTAHATNEVSISVPQTSDPYTHWPAYGRGNFAIGDSYQVCRLPWISEIGSGLVKVLYAQCQLTSGGSVHCFGAAPAGSKVKLLACGVGPQVDFDGTLDSVGTVWGANATISFGESGWVYNAILGNFPQTSYANTIVSFKHGTAGLVETVLQNACVDSRIAAHIRYSRVYAYDLVAQDQGPSVFLGDESGSSEFDQQVSGHNISAYCIFNETANFGEWVGVNPTTFTLLFNAPYDTQQIVYIREVGTPIQVFALTDVPIQLFARGGSIRDGYY